MTKKLPLIHLICDYGTGDLAFAEVINHLKHLLPEAQILPLSTPAFSTLNTGFLIAQLALYGKSKNIFIYSNTAPRKDDSKKRHQNSGEKFKYIQLKNGTQIAAVDAGYCFSFLKSHIKTLKNIKVENQGSQFRSRDFYPLAVASILNKDKKILGTSISTKHIPSIPKNLVMHIDGYGNIKTTIRHSELKLKPGSKIQITINNSTRTSFFASGNFAVKAGDLAFAPGSSGDKKDPFMEIFLRGSSAKKYFNHPKVEDKVALKVS